MMCFDQKGVQETTKDGVLRWDLQILAGFRDSFGKITNEVIKVGYASPIDPSTEHTMYTPVTLDHLTVGVMNRAAKDGRGQGGFTLWYRCDGMHPVTSVPPQTRKPVAAVAKD
jgi:hypothetical protein